jgi:hypothetical protein
MEQFRLLHYEWIIGVGRWSFFPNVKTPRRGFYVLPIECGLRPPALAFDTTFDSFSGTNKVFDKLCLSKRCVLVRYTLYIPQYDIRRSCTEFCRCTTKEFKLHTAAPVHPAASKQSKDPPKQGQFCPASMNKSAHSRPLRAADANQWESGLSPIAPLLHIFAAAFDDLHSQ